MNTRLAVCCCLLFGVAAFAAEPDTIRVPVRISANVATTHVTGTVESPVTRKTGRKVTRTRQVDGVKRYRNGIISVLDREVARNIPPDLRERGYNHVETGQDAEGTYVIYSRTVEEQIDEEEVIGRGRCRVRASISGTARVNASTRQVKVDATGSYTVERCEPPGARAGAEEAAKAELVRALQQINATPLALTADDMRALLGGARPTISKSVPFTFAGATGTLEITLRGGVVFDRELGI